MGRAQRVGGTRKMRMGCARVVKCTRKCAPDQVSGFILFMPIIILTQLVSFLSLGRSCLWCTATKKKCMLTKEGSKKSQRVFTKNMEKKNRKGKEKEKESRKKWKRDKEEEEKDKAVDDKEIELEENWQGFMMAGMMKMGLALERVLRENEELQKEIREMRRENTEDRQKYFREVRKVWKDTW